MTTGSLTGRITSGGAPVPGATVSALHVESGTRYGTTTRDDGRFSIVALPIGGPYRVTVARIGLADVSLAQELGRNVGGRSNALEARLDILNFGNLLNRNWGTGKRFVSSSPLTNPSVDGGGRLTYRLRNVSNQFVDHTYDPSATIGGVYRLQLSLRYNFQ